MHVSSDAVAVRAIRLSESEEFLDLMCRCFELDPALARSIFYSDPFFDLTRKRAVVDRNSGKLLSILTAVPTALRLHGGTALPVTGIAGVGTEPALQNRGYARLLFNQSLSCLASEFQEPLAALVTAQPVLYLRLGFQHCATTVDWRAPSAAFPEYIEGANVHLLSQNEKLALRPELRALYSERISSQSGQFIRSEQRWELIENGRPGQQVGIWRSKRVISAAIFFRELAEGDTHVLVVDEIYTANAPGCRAILGFLARRPHGQSVRGTGRWTDLHHLGIDRFPGIQLAQSAGVMMRITDLYGFLASLAAGNLWNSNLANMRDGLTIKVENVFVTQDRKPVRIFPYVAAGGSAGVGLSPADEMSGEWISGDIGPITQLLVGYRSATDLHDEEMLRCSSNVAIEIAEWMFPSTDPYLSPMDSF